MIYLLITIDNQNIEDVKLWSQIRLYESNKYKYKLY